MNIKKHIYPKYESDILIVGSGIAGLSLALRLSCTYKVIVLSKSVVKESATLYAQGGIAAVCDQKDHIDFHIQDTLVSGAGLCDYDAVSFVINNAHSSVTWLINNGVSFDIDFMNQEHKHYHLTQEGGHSHRRILHKADCTGREIENVLVNKALKDHNISICEHSKLIDLILSHEVNLLIPRRVIGAWIWNDNKKQIEIFFAKSIVLATGGASKVYKYTTNPDISTGDGIAIAWRAGCRVANLEFNQFHPTCLFYPKSKNFLLTESLRGEGAFLIRPDGSRFMQHIHDKAELAPRDIVTRAITEEIKRLNVECIYLNISHKPKKFIINHFPNIYNKLLKFGLDLTKHAIPVIPAAHYTCGGIMVNKKGRTDINGLYAIGEVSYTGLHGANRIASNSLLECLVYSQSAAEDLMKCLPKRNLINIIPDKKKRIINANNYELVYIKKQFEKIRLIMWNNVGIIRTKENLNYAKYELSLLEKTINQYYNNIDVSINLLDIRNLLQVANLIVQCALNRKESRGLHYIYDYPNLLSSALPTILLP
ncbi:MAG: L-aspartate oxidase [Pantoea sp. Brub]|nr:L-aspartate oxidase [Pantoea sp. Brub]